MTNLYFQYLVYFYKNKISVIFNFLKFNNIFTIINHSNKFIKINLKLDNKEIMFLNSFKIFFVKLNKLCEVFNVKNKYNQKFNHFDLFNNYQII